MVQGKSKNPTPSRLRCLLHTESHFCGADVHLTSVCKNQQFSHLTLPIPSLPFPPHHSCLVSSFLLLLLVSSGPAVWLCLKITVRNKFSDMASFPFWAYKIEWDRIVNTAHSSFKMGKRRNRRNKSINIFLFFSLLCSIAELFIHPSSEDPQPLPLPNSCLSFTSTAFCQPPDHSRTGNHSTQISAPLHHDSCLSL